MKSIVLAEKPSVAKEIARVLGCKRRNDGYIEGEKYIVTWALGHLITLADPEEYDEKYKRWNMDHLPMLPKKMKLTIIKNTSKQYRTVSALTKRADVGELIIATDSGREGELVARWILTKCGWRGQTKRLWISSQTDKAIKEGFASLKDAKEYENLYKSAAARAHADWVVGLNISRALTCKYNASLSAGRVQTPTLALIVERENAIKSFRPKDYYTVNIATDSFKALYKNKSGIARMYDRAEAEKIRTAVTGNSGTVSSLVGTRRETPPPAAYDLTELQRDANKKYGYSAKETLATMQSLYEYHKVLTYPRTDSRYITDDVADTLPDRLKSLLMTPFAEGAKALLKGKIQTKYIVNAAKVTDHHAIIPTEQRPVLSEMTAKERAIYELVVRRFIAVLSEPFVYEETKLVFTAGGYDFHAKGKVTLKQGWKAAYGASLSEEDEEDEDERSQSLPPLKKGQTLAIKQVKITEGKTKPPARYTEATLLSAMEHPVVEDKGLNKVLTETSGLGTPATRADIIEKLFSSFYIERKEKELFPTAKGIQLIGLVPADLKSAVLTAKWEEKLSLISKGKEKDKAFITEIEEYTQRLISAIKASEVKYVHENATKERCPECGEYLLDVKSKKGQLYVCSNPECKYRRALSVTTNARCPECHKTMQLRGEGEKKTFYCQCGYREMLSDFEAKKQRGGASKHEVKSYLKKQENEGESINSALAEQLMKWKNG